MHYTDFATDLTQFTGEQRLAEAIRYFSNAGVEELVVDLRYNAGGYLFLAAQLGYMVAGAAATAGKTFEQITFNDKRRAEDEALPFLGYRLGDSGSGLPALSLKRVFVLATGNTCSASESFISALRGIDIEVVLIGDSTCGKPYGFYQQNNCTLSYFALEFEGRNHKGEIFPATGITPACGVADDLSHPLGHPDEAMLAAALVYRDTGKCPEPAAGMAEREFAASAGLRSGVLGRSPLRSNKLLLR